VSDVVRRRLGLILVVAGTIILAFSVQTKRQYVGGMAKVIDRMKKDDPSFLELTETKIHLWRLRLGLLLVVVGTALQW